MAVSTTPKMVDLIRKLDDEREVLPDDHDRLMALLQSHADGSSPLPVRKGHEIIEWLLRQPRPTFAPPPEDGGAQRKAAAPGVYKWRGRVFVVRPSRDKTFVYARELVELAPGQGDRLTRGGERVRFEMLPAKGMQFRLAEGDRMPVEEGKDLTTRYGRCIACGRVLKVAESLERGIGPVCYGYFRK